MKKQKEIHTHTGKKREDVLQRQNLEYVATGQELQELLVCVC